MSSKLVVAHDFVCPWCWIGFLQVLRLRDAFDVEIEWVGHELYPEELEFPDYSSGAKSAADSDRPKTPGRLALAYAAEGMTPPTIHPPYPMRTHRAHNAVAYAKLEGVADQLVERLYRAYWQGGVEIERMEMLLMLGRGLIRDEQAYRRAIEERQFADKVIGFDEGSHAVGVYNVPTFYIGGERYAEQPYSVLFEAASKAFAPRSTLDLYSFLDLPPAHNDRPYTYANMVSSIDGRAVMDSRTQSVAGLGSAVDREMMRRLYRPADAIMVGAGTLRAEKRLSYPPEILRVVVTGTGNIDPSHDFFSGSAQQPVVVTTEDAVLPDGLEAEVLRCGRSALDLPEALKLLRARYGVETLHLHGGPRLLGSLFELDLVDDLFLTVAPKIRLGSDLPTIADAPALPTDGLLEMDLVSVEPIESELFLRYRRKRNV
ncbi:MAG: dihydrofolate reductase family protein [Fimbriimonadaceae bacterium]